MRWRIVLLVAGILATEVSCTRPPVASDPPLSASAEPSEPAPETPPAAASSETPTADVPAPPVTAPRTLGALPCGSEVCSGKTPVCSLTQDGFKVVGFACVASVAAAREALGFPVQCWSARDCPKGMRCYGSNEAICTRSGTPDISSGFVCESQADCDVSEVRRLTLKGRPDVAKREAKVVCSEPPKPGLPRTCAVVSSH